MQLLSDAERRFTYYNLSLGYNLLPGEVFIGRNLAMTSALYMIGGIGNVKFAGDQNFAVNFGAGFRVLPTDWLALHIDVQDLVFRSNDIGRLSTEEQSSGNDRRDACSSSELAPQAPDRIEWRQS